MGFGWVGCGGALGKMYETSSTRMHETSTAKLCSATPTSEGSEGEAERS